jgi:hypothetical protein
LRNWYPGFDNLRVRRNTFNRESIVKYKRPGLAQRVRISILHVFRQRKCDQETQCNGKCGDDPEQRLFHVTCSFHGLSISANRISNIQTHLVFDTLFQRHGRIRRLRGYRCRRRELLGYTLAEARAAVASENVVRLAVFELTMILSNHRFHDVHPPAHRFLRRAERWEGIVGLHEIRLGHRGLLNGQRTPRTSG